MPFGVEGCRFSRNGRLAREAQRMAGAKAHRLEFQDVTLHRQSKAGLDLAMVFTDILKIVSAPPIARPRSRRCPERTPRRHLQLVEVWL